MKTRPKPIKQAYHFKGIGVFSNKPLSTDELEQCEKAAKKDKVKSSSGYHGINPCNASA